jgi:hypothetical protein
MSRLGGAESDEGITVFGRPEGIHPEAGRRWHSGGGHLPQDPSTAIKSTLVPNVRNAAPRKKHSVKTLSPKLRQADVLLAQGRGDREPPMPITLIPSRTKAVASYSPDRNWMSASLAITLPYAE